MGLKEIITRHAIRKDNEETDADIRRYGTDDFLGLWCKDATDLQKLISDQGAQTGIFAELGKKMTPDVAKTVWNELTSYSELLSRYDTLKIYDRIRIEPPFQQPHLELKLKDIKQCIGILAEGRTLFDERLAREITQQNDAFEKHAKRLVQEKDSVLRDQLLNTIFDFAATYASYGAFLTEYPLPKTQAARKGFIVDFAQVGTLFRQHEAAFKTLIAPYPTFTNDSELKKLHLQYQRNIAEKIRGLSKHLASYRYVLLSSAVNKLRTIDVPPYMHAFADELKEVIAAPSYVQKKKVLRSAIAELNRLCTTLVKLPGTLSGLDDYLRDLADDEKQHSVNPFNQFRALLYFGADVEQYETLRRQYLGRIQGGREQALLKKTRLEEIVLQQKLRKETERARVAAEERSRDRAYESQRRHEEKTLLEQQARIREAEAARATAEAQRAAEEVRTRQEERKLYELRARQQPSIQGFHIPPPQPVVQRPQSSSKSPGAEAYPDGIVNFQTFLQTNPRPDLKAYRILHGIFSGYAPLERKLAAFGRELAYVKKAESADELVYMKDFCGIFEDDVQNGCLRRNVRFYGLNPEAVSLSLNAVRSYIKQSEIVSS